MSPYQRPRPRPRKKERRALALALLAVFGLIAAPVLHAQQHAREAEAERELTLLVQQLSLHGADFDEVFARAWQLASEKRPPHTHGEAPRGQHGNGTLEHFALALHAAPPPPVAPSPQAQPQLLAEAKPEAAPSQCRRSPVSSQGPPLQS